MSDPNKQKLRVYIAGPMRGRPYYNFPAFEQAAAKLAESGYIPISPAKLDRDRGFDPYQLPADTDWTTIEPTKMQMAEIVQQDIAALLTCQAIWLLRGWQDSIGACAEKAVAHWLGLLIWHQEISEIHNDNFCESEPTEDILEEALRITKGDRNAQYGPPDQDFQRTAQIWSTLKGVKFEPAEVATFMIALKLSRQTHQQKRDNWVDIAGYARCGSICS